MRCLKDDDTIVIQEADKGGVIIMLNKEYYKHKILDIRNK